MTFPCSACGALLWVDDFERGRAVMIGRLPYCASCEVKPKKPESHRGRVPLFAMPATPKAGPRRGKGWIWALLTSLALAGAAAWLILRGRP